jgi:CheY-like chemotaxis protein
MSGFEPKAAPLRVAKLRGEYGVTGQVPKHIARVIQSLGILVVEDNPYMRKVIRNLLTTIGVKRVTEAADGIEALEAIRTTVPDLVLLDWEMPLLSGAELVRIVRSPGVFPMPDVPIIMLSAHGERWRVIEAMRLGVNEYLIKPVSAQSLLYRMVAILANPRPIVEREGYYGPAPRRDLPPPLPRGEESAAAEPATGATAA